MRDGMRMLIELVQVRWLFARGAYRQPSAR